jgi:hypothetical protein
MTMKRTGRIHEMIVTANDDELEASVILTILEASSYMAEQTAALKCMPPR